MNDSNDTVLTLNITHGGQAHTLALLASAPIDDLRSAIETATSVPSSNQKIIHKGKTISTSSASAPLSSLDLQNGSKLLVIGSKATSVSSIVSQSLDLQRRFEVTSKREALQPRKTSSTGKRVRVIHDLRKIGTGAFGSVEVLQNCPHQDLRKERLVRLSKDEAVIECMKEREWSVGLLSELHPHRDPTLLGLNKNAGEAIYLRLLTDDLTGLRSYPHTRIVLLHELTHNKHGDHDQAFKTLNSLLNKEVKAYEAAKRAGAHRLGGEAADAYEIQGEDEVEQMCGSADYNGISASSDQQTSQIQGTKQVRDDTNGLWELEQRRQAILRAAEERLKKKSP